MTVNLGTRLEMYDWTEALTQEFALAPRDLVDKGLVDEEGYVEASRRFTRFVHRIMPKELSHLPAGGVEVLGAGLLRDLTWIPFAVRELGHRVAITDSNSFAYGITRMYLREKGISRRVLVRPISVEAAWRKRKGGIDESQIVAYYGGQFIQNQSEDMMREMMTRFGKFLRRPGSRQLYLLHARGEDNPSEDVRWNNTTPYFDAELIEPLEEGLRGPAEVTVLGKHKYYGHQTYTLFRFRRSA